MIYRFVFDRFVVTVVETYLITFKKRQHKGFYMNFD